MMPECMLTVFQEHLVLLHVTTLCLHNNTSYQYVTVLMTQRPIPTQYILCIWRKPVQGPGWKLCFVCET